MYNSGQDTGFATIAAGATLGTPLTDLLLADEIQPGSDPSYQTCKTIFTYHPLGEILADGGMTRAQAQPRAISVPVLGEKRLIEQFEKTWATIDGGGSTGIELGGTGVLYELFTTARIYGIASLGVGERGKDLSQPMDFANIAEADLFFNVLDPLNTAGSLVLDQDPNSPNFKRPASTIRVQGQAWHPSRIFPKLNGKAIYIEYTDSAFGFVGRSVYQRPLYPLKSFVQSMITDQAVTQKAALLVYKAKSPGSIIDNIMQTMASWKRGSIKAGVTGQVLQIGNEEEVESLNFQNLDGPVKLTRENILKNIASGAGMPASIVNNETLTEGFGEGSEDFKKEVAYLNFLRSEMDPAYGFLDKIVMRKAWTPAFFEALKVDYPEYGKTSFDEAFYKWSRAFSAAWPNLMEEPDSEKSKTEDVKFKSAVALAEVLMPELDPENKAKVIEWLTENANEAEHLFASKIDLDLDAMTSYFEENREMAQSAAEANAAGDEEDEPKAPEPFGARA